MTKERARANGTAMSRRTLLTALPASGTALATTQLAQAEEADTAILRLFRQHQEIMEASRTHTCTAAGKDVDAELNHLFYRPASCLERQMMALPSTCTADLAAKIVTYTAWGDFELPTRQHEFWAEMKALLATVRS